MSDLDPAETLLRYASGGCVSDNVVDGSAFMLKEKDKGRLSSSRPMVFAGTVAKAMPFVRAVSRLTLRPTGRFAEFTFQGCIDALEEIDEIKELAALEDALIADGDFCADPSHAVLVGLPGPGSPLAEMCGDLIANTVTNLHLAVAHD